MNNNKRKLGWREWVALPLLDIDRLKAKVDTGAKTSALHAFELHPFQKDDEQWVEFSIHPKQRNTEEVVRCQAPVIEQRSVRDSGGHVELRYVINTVVAIGGDQFEIDMTLTSRDDMGFRMLLGRGAISGQFIVDPARSYLAGKEPLAKPKKDKVANR